LNQHNGDDAPQVNVWSNVMQEIFQMTLYE